MEKEIWQPVPYPPFGKYYDISSLGRIKKKARRIVQNNRYGTNSLHIRPERIKEYTPHINYELLYCVLRISHKGKEIQKTVYPHKACAEVFVPKPDDSGKYKYAGFKDGDCTNLFYQNLYWYTHSELMMEAHELHPEKKDLVYFRTVEAGRALTRDQHATIRARLMRNEDITLIARDFGVTNGSIVYHLNKMCEEMAENNA